MKKRKLTFIEKNLYLVLICFVLLSVTTIGYSALNQALYITGDLALRASKDIRITKLELLSKSDETYEQYNYRYTTDTASMFLILPSINSNATYQVTVSNSGDADMMVDKLNVSTSLSSIEYSLTGINNNTIIKSKEILTFNITLTRKQAVITPSEVSSILLELTWRDPIIYSDSILVGNDPDLLNNSLTPVVYDETKSSWVVADITKEWYSYADQEWANAVILNNGTSKNVGDTVTVPTSTSSTTEVKAMYVWIPRYSYTIKSEDGTNYYGKTISSVGGSTASLSTPGAIDIKFVSTDTIETGTAQYTGNTATNWHTHPAFMWDTNSDGTISSSENINGIWVGKFETTGTANAPTVLPNQQSLRDQNVSTQFTTSKKFNTYLSNSTNIDSHMMKNSEWGAVTYLSQSIYGKYGNSNYTGQYKEIYKNDTGYYYTGRSSGTYPQDDISTFDTCLYNDITNRGSGTGACGSGASTTGNITGVYDMSGGVYEYVMSYLTTASSTWGATSDINYAEFTETPAIKYFDAYTLINSPRACSGGVCFGHALSETSNWYADAAYFIAPVHPWLLRGGDRNTNTETGIFNFLNYNGAVSPYYSFRMTVLKEG